MTEKRECMTCALYDHDAIFEYKRVLCGKTPNYYYVKETKTLQMDCANWQPKEAKTAADSKGGY